MARPGKVTAFGILDLDDVRPQVSEQPRRRWTGQGMSQVDDPHTRQRAVHQSSNAVAALSTTIVVQASPGNPGFHEAERWVASGDLEAPETLVLGNVERAL